MSLADELLADLDEVGAERDEDEQWQNEDEMEVANEIQGSETISDKSIKSITKLLDSKEVCIVLVVCLLLAFLYMLGFESSQ